MIARTRRFGGILSAIVVRNISVFIAWGLLAALFVGSSWIPNTSFANLVQPISIYLIPTLVAFSGGMMVDDYEGGAVGALCAIGFIVESEVPMFFGALVMGPLSAWAAKRCKHVVLAKVTKGFEMLGRNLTAAAVGLVMCLISYAYIGPFLQLVNRGIVRELSVLVEAGMLPLLAVVNEPAKALFLNNVIDQGFYYPMGMQEALTGGKSILFMAASNPGAGLGLLLAYGLLGRDEMRKTAPGAAVIHFLGGIHEMYIPYVLVNPKTIVGMIAGSACGIFVFERTGVGLTAGPSPGSFVAYLLLAPKGDLPGVLLGIGAAAGVSFGINSLILRISEPSDEKAENPEVHVAQTVPIHKIVFACDLGLGTSVMGAVNFKKKLRRQEIPDVAVESCAVEQLPPDADVVVTQEAFEERARLVHPEVRIVTVTDFLLDPALDLLLDEVQMNRTTT